MYTIRGPRFMYVCMGYGFTPISSSTWTHRKFMRIGCYLVVVFLVLLNQLSRSQTVKFM